MKKRILPLLLIILLLGAVCAFGPADSPSAFGDMAVDDPRYPLALALTRTGIMEDGDVFRPDDKATLREVTETLLRALDIPFGGDAGPIAVDNRLFYVFDGWTPGPVSRLTAARMAARGLDLLPMAEESPFADCDDGFVSRLAEVGVLQRAAFFRPDEPITRWELALLARGILNFRPPEDSFRYSNYWVKPLEGVAPFQYDSLAFDWSDGRPVYTGEGFTSRVGVDVSGYQGDIDWEAVAADGIQFALIRVGGRFINSGKLYDDSTFEKNITGALAAGLDVGVYFFSQAITAAEGVEEAAFVLERVKGYDLTMPVVIDWEYLGAPDCRTYGVEPAEITAGIAAFCTAVEEAGYTPAVYCNAYCGYIKMDLRALSQWELWFAQYTDSPAFRYHFSLWQYTDTGRVAGIPSEVDLNVQFIRNE